MNSPEPDIVLRLPLPNVDIDELELYEIKDQFRSLGRRIKLQPEDEFPIAPSWAELALAGASFFSGVVVTHYAEKLFDAFDSLVKKRIDQLNLTIRSETASVYRHIPLRDRKLAIEILEEALGELKIFSEQNDTVIYWPTKTEKKQNGELWIYTSVKNGGGLKILKPDDPQYSLWCWVIGQVEGQKMVTGDVIDRLTTDYKDRYTN